MATAGKWGRLPVKLDPELVVALADIGYSRMTPCQAAAIPPLLQHQDVAVDAETGSGKTLAFLVPIAQLLLYSQDTRCLHPTPTVRALVIVPTRELAAQVHSVASALFSLLPGDITPVPLIGGESAQYGPGPAPEHRSDTRIVIATPGRLNAAFQSHTLSCRSLEVLILDEADRLLDMGFSVSLTSILTRLPKQRRTGLYSATQTEQVDELARAGLRNPVRVAVRVRSKAVSGANSIGSGASKRRVIPASLTCYYHPILQEHKLHHLLDLLARHQSEKFILYMLTCACVDFFMKLPLQKLFKVACADLSSVSDGSDLPVLSLHGKMSQAKRSRALAKFACSRNALLVCTDVAARGLDIPDVDWIVQFDAPQDPDAYVHRVGRTARLGRKGTSLIYLTPSEDAYPNFLSVRKCPVLLLANGRSSSLGWKPDAGKMESSVDACRGSQLSAEYFRIVKKCVVGDRAVMELGEKAFLSYMRAYKEHKCNFILPLKDLNVGSLARSFSLLRLPRFQEFKKYRGILDFQKETSIRVRDVAYKDASREKSRQVAIQDAVENRAERRRALQAKSKKTTKARKRPRAENIQMIAERKRVAQENEDMLAEDEMMKEAGLVKKCRRGKLSRADFNHIAGYDDLAPLDATEDTQ